MRNSLDISSGYRKFCSRWWRHYFRPQLYINAIKYTYQRITRGWANCDTWSMDSYLAEVLPEMLTHLRNTKHGVPSEMFPDDYAHTGCSSNEEESRKIHAVAEAKWNDTLDRMIAGFTEYKLMLDSEFPKEYVKELDTSTGWNKEFGLKDISYDWDAIRAWEKERVENFRESWNLVGKHFGSLWD